MSFSIRPTRSYDAIPIAAVHRATAAMPGGIARRPEEITDAYIDRILHEALADGVGLVAVDAAGTVVGEIHAVRIPVKLFSHVLSDLTVAVHPDWRGRGVGSALFQALFAAARAMDPPIVRVELNAGAGNAGALRLYERLGFRIEGRLEKRGRFPDGTFEDDIAMGLILD
ncbi:GNAT family N-acetyltransferase [Caulobacter flavus]|uniref:GNAT family N-acetyltransferase n=1 Tax=Caulobacter flavus TaxID=1679497 RepID=A0A2N5CL80_9CAUL|nr:GNAT family N-acetyltransferase [Caulobacter flavus]AYV48335.1 GNAT family N-acetyltransferase [Caulobacter flavus]PLR06495.1 GNAT family N-acetyltransferase [Caulobacter flavus]